MSYQIATEGFFNQYKNHNHHYDVALESTDGKITSKWLYQRVTELIVPIFKLKDFKKFVIHFVCPDDYSYKDILTGEYIVDNDGNCSASYGMKNINRQKLTDAHWDIYHDILPIYREATAGKLNWTAFTITIRSNGKNDIIFTEDRPTTEYLGIWKYANLGIMPDSWHRNGKIAYDAVQKSIKQGLKPLD